MQINIQCIRNKILEIEQFCDVEKIDIICISEHWLEEDQVNCFVPLHFEPASVVCRQNRKNGGVGIYIKNELQYSIIDLTSFNREVHFEVCAVKVIRPCGNLNIVSIYRSPIGDVTLFFQLFELVTKKYLRNQRN